MRSFVLFALVLSACQGPFSTACLDVDGDGFPSSACPQVYYDQSLMGGDCDDLDPDVHPAAEDPPCDGVDQNCDGYDAFPRGELYRDSDGDGHGVDSPLTQPNCGVPAVGFVGSDDDCDDENADRYPGNEEVPDDGVDQDCNGTDLVLVDADGDGYGPSEDCDDEDPSVHPGAVEVCNRKDDDCDGYTDAEDPDVSDALTLYLDNDRDGYGQSSGTILSCEPVEGYAQYGGDCNDTSTLFHPGAAETDCSDPNDYNCDGSTGMVDRDSDGFVACADCNDFDRSTYPGATEFCDGFDNNCDGVTDGPAEAVDTELFFADVDGDGHGNADITTAACMAPDGYVALPDDCDDENALRFPGNLEVCDDLDNNCNSIPDDGVLTYDWHLDADGDGYGDMNTSPITGCSAPSTLYKKDIPVTDCDDENALRFPGNLEVCDDLDNNCNQSVDEGLLRFTWYKDADGDNYGDSATQTLDCNSPGPLYKTGILDTDCDDNASTVHPGATEVCNGVDDNCVNGVDDADPNVQGQETWYLDADGDGYGDATVLLKMCVMPTGYAASDLDCDDNASAVHPGATEVCNGKDDNCVNGVDEGVQQTFFFDADSDGYGDPMVATAACSVPSGYVSNDDDCNDLANAVHPGATEVCNGVDDNCVNGVDDADPNVQGQETWYLDADGDGYGVGQAVRACVRPLHFAPNPGDCDDDATAVHPGATEVCNGVDDDCVNGADVDAVDGDTYYRDHDGDGYGDPSTSTVRCALPSGFVLDDSDCDDGSAYVNPTQVESKYTAEDDNCDGVTYHLSGATFTLSGSPQKVRFTSGNLIEDPCDATMRCGEVLGWDIFSYYLHSNDIQTGILSFGSTLGHPASALLFDDTNGAASIEDECRAYAFPTTIGTQYGMTVVIVNHDANANAFRIFKLSSYSNNRSTAVPLYSPYLETGVGAQAVVKMTADTTFDGFVLCAGGVTTSSAVGFTEVYVGAVVNAP